MFFGQQFSYSAHINVLSEQLPRRRLLPPRGGIAPECAFGAETPALMVAISAGRRPSLQSHCPLLRSEPIGLPLALDPWQPAQVPPLARP
jgi:hypothetical protein